MVDLATKIDRNVLRKSWDEVSFTPSTNVQYGGVLFDTVLKKVLESYAKGSKGCAVYLYDADDTIPYCNKVGSCHLESAFICGTLAERLRSSSERIATSGDYIFAMALTDGVIVGASGFPKNVAEATVLTVAYWAGFLTAEEFLAQAQEAADKETITSVFRFIDDLLSNELSRAA